MKMNSVNFSPASPKLSDNLVYVTSCAGGLQTSRQRGLDARGDLGWPWQDERGRGAGRHMSGRRRPVTRDGVRDLRDGRARLLQRRRSHLAPVGVGPRDQRRVIEIGPEANGEMSQSGL